MKHLFEPGYSQQKVFNKTFEIVLAEGSTVGDYRDLNLLSCSFGDLSVCPICGDVVYLNYEFSLDLWEEKNIGKCRLCNGF